MSEGKGWRGYIFSREIGGQLIPQRVQSLVIRNYSEKMGMQIIFSIVEYYMEDCYMMLDSYLGELNSIVGFVFYSTHLLPQDEGRRIRIYEMILSNGCELHFALEELAIIKESDTQMIEDILLCRILTKNEGSLPLIAEELPDYFAEV